MRAIVVDGDPLTRRSTADALRPAGFDVSEASSGGEVLELCRTTPPEVVLMDVVLPDLDGLTVMRRILILEPRVTVVLLSASGDTALARVALRAGAAGFLRKGTGWLPAALARDGPVFGGT